MVNPIENPNPAGSLTEGLKEKREPSLGEFNPLIFPPDLSNPETLDVLRTVINKDINRFGFCQPSSIETSLAWASYSGKMEPRVIIRFEPHQLSEKQLELLENVTKKTYKGVIAGRTASNNQPIPASFYPNLEMPKGRREVNEDARRLGWYMGPRLSTPSAGNEGLFVYRDLGKVDMAAYLKSHGYKEWFFKDNLITPLGKPVDTKYIVEIHEASLYQTDIVEYVLQVASILSEGKEIDNPKLKYEIYNDLNRLGLKKTRREDVQGLDEQLGRIERTLILPLANLDVSSAINLDASSVLLIGVPGTGKTFAVEYFLQQDNGVFILPIDSRHIAQELSQPPEKMRILPRISEVFKQTQIPVILHIDDIEKIGQTDLTISSTILNLMAGVRENGFFTIASTNYPEKLTPQLLQPQRFSEIIYFGLQPEEVRLKILETHANRVSKELGKPLFASDEEREAILEAVAKVTESYTPRYLGDICTQAKTFLLKRETQEKNKKHGLTESDLNTKFTVEDWQCAIEEVSKKYNKEEVIKRDEELRKFAAHYNGTIGFLQNKNGHMPDLSSVIFDMKTAKKTISNN